MILRLLRGRIAAADVERVRSRLQRRIDTGRVGARGLLGVRTGVRYDGEVAHLVLASIWDSHSAMEDGAAAEYRLPREEQPFAGLLEPPSTETYELVTEVVRSVALLDAGVLRVHCLVIPRHREAEFFRFARGRAEELLARPEVTDVYVARRLRGDGDIEILLLVGWRDLAGFRAHEPTDERAATIAEARDLISEHIADTYLELGYRVPLAVDGPALLVTDNLRQVVDVTRAAALLLGRDPWDVVGTRLDEIVPGRTRDALARQWADFEAAGRLTGDFVLARGGRGEMLIHVHAERDTPVPDRHTFLMVPRAEAVPDDEVYAAAIARAFRREVDAAPH